MKMHFKSQSFWKNWVKWCYPMHWKNL